MSYPLLLAASFCTDPTTKTDGCGLPTTSLNPSTLQTVTSNVFLGVGILAVIFLIIGGIRYAISGGDAKNIKEAKETILYAIIGLVLALLAFTLVIVIGNVAGGGHL